MFRCFSREPRNAMPNGDNAIGASASYSRHGSHPCWVLLGGPTPSTWTTPWSATPNATSCRGGSHSMNYGIVGAMGLAPPVRRPPALIVSGRSCRVGVQDGGCSLMIEASVPVRICDIGGWTDTWFGGPGRVLNVAVTPGVEVSIGATAGPARWCSTSRPSATGTRSSRRAPGRPPPLAGGCHRRVPTPGGPRRRGQRPFRRPGRLRHRYLCGGSGALLGGLAACAPSNCRRATSPTPRIGWRSTSSASRAGSRTSSARRSAGSTTSKSSRTPRLRCTPCRPGRHSAPG